MKEAEKPVLVTQIEESGLTAEVIASDIHQIAEASKKMLGGRLTRKALVLLLNEDTKVPKSHITKILDALPELKHWASAKK